MQEFESHISFICPYCEKHSESAVYVPEPEWALFDRMSDVYSEGTTDVTCSECSSDFEAYVQNYASGCEVTLNDFPDVDVDASMAFYTPDPDEYYEPEYEIPDNPHTIFNQSYTETTDMLESYGDDSGNSLINRMVFVQQVTALEAYLSDTLIKSCSSDDRIVKKILSKNKQLIKEKYTLEEIASNPSLVKDKVLEFLYKITFHNLRQVIPLYMHAFDINILEPLSDDQKSQLFSAILHRHDCVHRNGYDKDGNQLDVFTKQYVLEVANISKAIVDQIRKKLIDDLFDPPDN